MKKVPASQVATAAEAPESPLPPQVQEALGELVGAVFGRPRDDLVALEKACALHALALELKDVVALLPTDHVWDLDVLIDVLLGEDRLARSGPARIRSARRRASL